MADSSIALPPIGQAVKVSVELLDFDVNNPRFTPDKRPSGNGDVAVIAMLASSADLSELVQSISTSGYINIEPLIVIERGNRLAVLEGNRRLAAIKALRDKETAKAARVSVPTLTDTVRATLDEVLCYRVASEDQARDLIGFKHINGPQSWDAFAKARFASRWLDDERQKAAKNLPSLSLQQIAGRMGDQNSTMHRMVSAMYVLEQAEEKQVFSVSDRAKKSFSFSHLYTGLAYEEFTNYLGMPRPNRAEDPERSPVPDAFVDKLGQLLRWLYGSKSREIEPVVKSQNPDLGRLREALGSDTARTVLVTRNNLDEALTSAQPADLKFQTHLIAANAELLHAQSSVEGFDASSQPELQKIAEAALRRAQLIKLAVDAAVRSEKDRVKAN